MILTPQEGEGRIGAQKDGKRDSNPPLTLREVSVSLYTLTPRHSRDPVTQQLEGTCLVYQTQNCKGSENSQGWGPRPPADQHTASGSFSVLLRMGQSPLCVGLP